MSNKLCSRCGIYKAIQMEKGLKILGVIIIIAGFVISVILAYHLRSLTGIGIMGICVLFFVLIGSNFLSKELDLTTGEVRRAIAISFVSVFFGLLAVGDKINANSINNSILKDVLENFWWITMTVIGFYFGGRSAEKIVESITEKWAKRLEEKVEKLEKAIQERTAGKGKN